MERAQEAAQTMRMGGGIGYDFSTLRPRGALIRRLMSHSSGPVSFMSIFDAICVCIASAGHRRGAQMAVMRIDHPDIEEFVHAKNNAHALTGFNTSIAVTDKFMEALEHDYDFPLQFEGEIYRHIKPKPLWEAIMRSTWDWGEPGVLFIDRINEMNPLYYCETISATNPCGEQPLPPYGACLLGSWNLVKYLRPDFSFDWQMLSRDIPVVVRAMDNIIDLAIYPLPQQKAEALLKRRMGIGVTGLANTLEAMGHRYASPLFLVRQEEIQDFILQGCYQASMELSKEKGCFPLWDPNHYTSGKFFRETIDEDLKLLIKKHGLRNSHLTSIAPTGTISLCADNVSSGIEPVFKHKVTRMVNRTDGPVQVELVDYAYREFGVEGRTYDQVSPEDHLEVLKIAGKFVDSAVSKTCNVPSDMPWEDFKHLYVEAWKGGCKGLTTFQPNGKRAGIMEESNESCTIDPETGVKECG